MGQGPELPDKKTEEARAFLESINTGDLETVRRMIRSNGDLLFAVDYPASAVTREHPEIAEYLARTELQRLREGTVPKTRLHDVIHDLGEAAHVSTGYRGCESLRVEAAPVIAGFLAHDHWGVRYGAVSVLAHHWDMKQCAPTLQQMGLSDPDEFVRHLAVSAVGWLLRDSRDADATQYLLGIFRDPAQPAWVREEAYEGLVGIWQGEDTAHALYMRKSERKQVRRGDAERAGWGVQGGRQTPLDREAIARAVEAYENVWEEFVDWNFVAQIEKEAG